MAGTGARRLARVVPEQEVVEILPGFREEVRPLRARVVDEDTLVDRNVAQLDATRFIANAAGVSDWLIRALAEQFLVALGYAVPVAFRWTVELDLAALLAPGTPEADETAVEGDAFAQRIEAGLCPVARNALSDADQRG